MSFFKSLKSNWDKECSSFAQEAVNNAKYVQATFCGVFRIATHAKKAKAGNKWYYGFMQKDTKLNIQKEEKLAHLR